MNDKALQQIAYGPFRTATAFREMARAALHEQTTDDLYFRVETAKQFIAAKYTDICKDTPAAHNLVETLWQILNNQEIAKATLESGASKKRRSDQ